MTLGKVLLASGKILKAYAQDFEALSKDGHLYVVVQNTGYVTADFSVVISECSGAIGKFREKSLSINPQKTHLFTFNIHAYGMEGGNDYCVVKLFDSRHKMVDSANVTFTTTAPCVCAAGCGCSCYENGFKCVERDDREWDEEKPTESGLDMGGVIDIWTKVKNFVKKIGKILKFLTSPGGIAAIVGILVALGALKACMGLRRKGAAVARFGMGGVKKGKQEERDKAGQIIVVEYNDEGEQIDPVTKDVTKPRNKTKEFFFNLVFFLILPVLLLFKLCKKITKCCCKKKPATKEETEEKTEDEDEGERQGPEVDIFKEGDILKDKSPPTSNSRVISKENVAGTMKRNHSTDSSRSSLVIKKSKHGSEDESAVTGNRRALTSSRVSVEMMEAKTSSHDNREASVEKTEPSPPEDIKPLLDTLVYHQFYSTDAVAGELENPGEQFSLAGKIACVPRPSSIQYRFDLLMALQICGNVDGQQVLLSTPRILEPFLFSKLMTVGDIRERITLHSQAPCLNLK